MAKHFVQVSNRQVEVRVLRDVHGGVQVEIVRRYPAAGLCRGQLMTVPHSEITTISNRKLRDIQKAKAFRARCRQWDREKKAAAEKAAKPAKRAAGTSVQTCPVCASEHASGACTMASADMTSK